jgi:3-hydroxyacyl-CoA dehydrogenase/enoyl-CoA hydratase/3-hydroxybutyryl-CoA epimerase
MIEVIQFPTPIPPSFVAALKRAEEDPEVEAIILEFSDDNPDLDDELEVLLKGDNVIDPLRDTLRVLETQPKPLVGLIRRSLDGLAFEVALACHKRFVLEHNLTFHWRWSELGLLPALGTGHRLAHLVGLEKTVQALLFSSPLAPADFLAETRRSGGSLD